MVFALGIALELAELQENEWPGGALTESSLVLGLIHYILLEVFEQFIDVSFETLATDVANGKGEGGRSEKPRAR
jgi:hypothetical protein